MKPELLSDPALAAGITKRASQQTYYTIRFLVDRPLVEDAFRAYAYFRWLDDWLDQCTRSRSECLEFVRRQEALVENCYRGVSLTDLAPEEHLLADLIQRDTEKKSGLQAYIRNMMAVMAFDAERRGRLISQRELNNYTRWLATAVTEALHYFIGHNCRSPHSELRYQAVIGAHITHMLRDAREDAGSGYYNLPLELVSANRIDPGDVTSQAYRDWVKTSVIKARQCFTTGREYLSQVENFRCRFAGYAYIHRFEIVLDSIERENFLLREQYPERKTPKRGLSMVSWAMWMALKVRRPAPLSSTVPVR